MAEFLFEIGLEEVPARMIAGAQAELQRRVVAMLERERLVGESVASKSFSTPRRLAVWVAGVAARQADVSEEMVGPAVKIAYKDGKPGPAAMAFAKKAGVEVAALKTVTTPKGEYLAATSVKAGRAAAEVIAEEMPKELAGIYWAKNMYWRRGQAGAVCAAGALDAGAAGRGGGAGEFGGKTAGNTTRGHRVLAGDKPIAIGFPDEYEQALLAAKVIADVESAAADDSQGAGPGDAGGGRRGLRWREDHALVDTGDAPDGVADGDCGRVRAGVSGAAGRGAGDGDARPPEVFCGGGCEGQAGAAFSGGAEYGDGCEGRGGDPAWK